MVTLPKKDVSGLAYVAFSRVKSIEVLIVSDFNIG